MEDRSGGVRWGGDGGGDGVGTRECASVRVCECASLSARVHVWMWGLCGSTVVGGVYRSARGPRRERGVARCSPCIYALSPS